MSRADLRVLVPQSIHTLPYLYFSDTLEDGASIVVPSCLFQARDIPLGLPAQREKGLGFCSNQQLVVNKSVEQGLDSIAVSRSDEKLSACIVDAECKLSAQLAEE